MRSRSNCRSRRSCTPSRLEALPSSPVKTASRRWSWRTRYWRRSAHSSGATRKRVTRDASRGTGVVMPRILIVTGEASGDLHGANLANAIRALRPDTEVLGVGGSKMKGAGVTLIHGIERLDVVGVLGLANLRAAMRTYFALARFLRKESLDVVVFIDHPGMNLRLARVASRAGHRVVYYIAPQIWACGGPGDRDPTVRGGAVPACGNSLRVRRSSAAGRGSAVV